MKSIAVALLFFCLIATAHAQLSPGELHRSHAFLEGLQNCRKCHGGNQELVPDNCLQCHGSIKSQRDSKTGLHSRPEYLQCQTCHVEHQGKEVELVHWKDGQGKFNHSQTSFPLLGAHVAVDCRKCHNPNFISKLTLLANEKIDSTRTFLGLQSNCTNCHRDEHRGQLDQNCLKCHTNEAWKPTVGFDHAATTYPLTGAHLKADCAKCHQPDHSQPIGEDMDFVRFANVGHNECSSCHIDPHKSSLGENCSSCHSTASWQQVNSVNFDHSKTRFPLLGKHQAVTCANCHSSGSPKRGMKFDACMDCHTDYHHGEFSKRESKGKCEECHTVNGFSPANFLLSQHAQSDFPLLGAHQAVPCLACHATKSSATTRNMTFAFASTKCLVCHKDPHGGQVDKLVKADGCEHCHAVDSWQTIKFDHAATKFPLEGKHAVTACSKCHVSKGSKSNVVSVNFTAVQTDCQSCHADIHRGQLATTAGVTDCARCHSAKGWEPRLFDHNQSRYLLDGAHKSVACAKCHPTRTDTDGPYVVLKPLETTCVSCHGKALPERSHQ